MLTAKNSRTIEALRFPLVFLVILIHASGTQIAYGNGSVSAPGGFCCLFVQHLVSGVLAQAAVPVFFLVSGLLFFREGRMSPDLVGQKWRNRVRTLLVPFLLWNALVLIGQAIGQSIPQTRVFFSGDIFDVHAATPYALADSLLGFDRGPVNIPLWFLRDLIVVSALAPILYLFLKVTRGWCLVLLAVLWIQFVPGKNSPPFSSPGSLFFFSLGAWFAGVTGSSLSAAAARPFLSRTVVSIYLLSACVEAYLLATGSVLFLLHQANVLLGMYFLWWAASRLLSVETVGGFLVSLGPSAFFVYLAHGQVLQLFKKLPYRILRPSGDLAILAIYLFSSLLTALSLWCLYLLLRRYLPRVCAVLTGKGSAPLRTGVRKEPRHLPLYVAGRKGLARHAMERTT